MFRTNYIYTALAAAVLALAISSEGRAQHYEPYTPYQGWGDIAKMNPEQGLGDIVKMNLEFDRQFEQWLRLGSKYSYGPYYNHYGQGYWRLYGPDAYPETPRGYIRPGMNYYYQQSNFYIR